MLKVAFAGSSIYSKNFAENFENIKCIITPKPKPVGRKKQIILNPLHKYALEKNIKLFTIEKFDKHIVDELLKIDIDFLIVVDFGFFIPKRILNWPKIACINIHPSDLPKYRGSSPGQFVILNNEKQSAVTVMKMNEFFDQGDIVFKKKFALDEIGQNFTAKDYYDFAFSLLYNDLKDILKNYAKYKKSTPQPKNSPTKIARKIKKADGFIPCFILKKLLKINFKCPNDKFSQNSLLKDLEHLDTKTQQEFIKRAYRAFYPWPGLYTKLLFNKKDKQILKLVKLYDPSIINGLLSFNKIRIEGKSNFTTFDNIKNSLVLKN